MFSDANICWFFDSIQYIEEYMTDNVCDDMAIYDNLPINWWLDNECICYLLVTLVCDLPDILNKPESIPAGATRNIQCKQSAEEYKRRRQSTNTTGK